MRIFPIFAAALLCAVEAWAVGNNTIDTLATVPDPNGVISGLNAPVMGLDATVYWEAGLQAGGNELVASGAPIAGDSRTISEAGPYPVGVPVDVLGSTVLNQGAIFVDTGNGFLHAPALFENGTTAELSYESTFPSGITSDENLP